MWPVWICVALLSLRFPQMVVTYTFIPTLRIPVTSYQLEFRPPPEGPNELPLNDQWGKACAPRPFQFISSSSFLFQFQFISQINSSFYSSSYSSSDSSSDSSSHSSSTLNDVQHFQEKEA
ncbi:GH15865 [Drosophila grimshawi]|uniref:GH15865 n=1 Tax=Drosophila grimshawi TaxID=7222 RepID=B4J0C2_DROGR|nr:GH15865 [Drosophila grimshawi]